MTHICVSEFTIIGSDNDLSPSRRQAIIWTNVGIVNSTLRNKLQWKFDRSSNIFIQENGVENVVCEMASICLGLNELMLRLVSYPWLNFTVVGIEILIETRSRYHKHQIKGKKKKHFQLQTGCSHISGLLHGKQWIRPLKTGKVNSCRLRFDIFMHKKAYHIAAIQSWANESQICRKCSFCRGHLIKD